MKFHAHIADTVGCAEEAQDVIRRARASIRIELKKHLGNIAEATDRGCACHIGLFDEDIKKIISRLDEDLDEVLADVMSDLDERAGGEA